MDSKRLSTPSPVFADIVIPNETALTAPSNEAPETPNQNWLTRPKPEKIAEQIIKLYDNQKLATTLAENAYELVSKFNINYWYSEFMRLM